MSWPVSSCHALLNVELCSFCPPRRQAHLCILSNSVDEPMYTKLIEALCAEHGINLLKVRSLDSLQLERIILSRTSCLSSESSVVKDLTLVTKKAIWYTIYFSVVSREVVDLVFFFGHQGDGWLIQCLELGRLVQLQEGGLVQSFLCHLGGWLISCMYVNFVDMQTGTSDDKHAPSTDQGEDWLLTSVWGSLVLSSQLP